MAKSFRQIIDSILFAGMKSGVAPSQPRQMPVVGRLHERLDRFLNGTAPDDPFYLTNRTWPQRMKVWLLIAVPVLVVAAIIGFGVVMPGVRHERQPAESATKPVGAKVLSSDLDKPIQLPVREDLELLEARIDHGTPVKLVGQIRNRTDRTISRRELVFDLTDIRGGRLGAVSVTAPDVPPHQAVTFQLPIQQTTAAFAMMRSQ